MLQCPVNLHTSRLFRLSEYFSDFLIRAFVNIPKLKYHPLF